MTEVRRILDQYDRVMNGDAWHGDPIWQILDGISAEKAALRPIANAHSIWEIVGHMAFWEDVAARRLGGLRAGLKEEGNFPPCRLKQLRPTGRLHLTHFAHPTKHCGRRCKNSIPPGWTSGRLPASDHFTMRRTG